MEDQLRDNDGRFTTPERLALQERIQGLEELLAGMDPASDEHRDAARVIQRWRNELTGEDTPASL